MGASSGWKAPPGWRKIRLQVFAVKGRSCYRCGAYATTVDHAVPVVLGGTHDLSNLRPACSRCNSSTGASLGNRLGPPRGYRRRGRRRPAAGAVPPVPAPWITSRDW
jgi:5-methylcytosine-specific restriction endonuclease McrA